MEYLLISILATFSCCGGPRATVGGTLKRELLSPQSSTAQATLAASTDHPVGQLFPCPPLTMESNKYIHIALVIFCFSLEKKRAKVSEQPTPPIQEETEPVSNVLQGDDILALAIKKEDLKKVRMKSRNPFLQEFFSPSLCGLEHQPCPPSLLIGSV